MSAALLGTVEKHGSGLQIVIKERMPVGNGYLMMFRMQLGHLQEQDVGKRVFYDRDTRIFTMENNEQRDKRSLQTAMKSGEPFIRNIGPNVYDLDRYRK